MQHSQSSKNKDIAIIGIACRFPGGANSAEAFWQLLSEGFDAIVDVPSDRWSSKQFYDPDPKKPGKTYMHKGGFLEEKLDQFDSQFFGISPREAETLDPQQRLMLEVSWEALEDAGLLISQSKGQNIGVYTGGFTLDNKVSRMGVHGRDFINSHTAVSSTMAILSNRISHAFDFKGPSLSVDTACSSSLVAFHLACQAIKNGECSLAIAGGVNTMLRPEYSVAMSKGQFLAKDGRCKTFDEKADGYSRGEGAGAIILKSYADAIRDGDTVYALVRGSGVNQDGHTPGISLPNQQSQEELMQQVYANASINADQISYIEAHGTGTQAGDIAETNAIGNVIGQAKKNQGQPPVIVGSVKTNLGHLEAGAGIAAVIKTALSLYHNKIPKNLHFNKPNPKINFTDLNIDVPTEMQAWPNHHKEKLSGINSFGYGGTNAHVVLQQADIDSSSEQNIAAYDQKNTQSNLDNMLRLYPLSAQSESALLARAEQVLKIIKHDDCKLTDLHYTLTQRRSNLDCRVVFLASSQQELADKLQAFIDGVATAGVVTGRVLPAQEKIFVFTGMGPQWWGMGQELFQTEAVFKNSLLEADAIFQKYAGWSILQEMLVEQSLSRMDQPEISQPANFILQVALTALYKSYGIQPNAVIGHSVGEVTAAYVSGGLSLEDAIRVSYYRSQLQQRVNGKGKMLAVGLSSTEALELIAGMENLVSLASINSESSVALSGDLSALEEIASVLEEQGVFQRLLDVDVAYHSYQMDDLQDELMSFLSDLTPQKPLLALYSTVTGKCAEYAIHDAAYWWGNVRGTVHFEQAMSQLLLEQDCQHIIEVGPQPVLASYIKSIARMTDSQVNVYRSMHRYKAETITFHEALGSLFSNGCTIDFKHWPIFEQQGKLLHLPAYPWQRESCWFESIASQEDRLGFVGHALLGQKNNSATVAWQVQINDQLQTYIKDHKVSGNVVYPAAAYIETALAAAEILHHKTHTVLEHLNFSQALVLADDQVTLVEFSVASDETQFSISSSHTQARESWSLHAKGRFLLADIELQPENINLIDIKKRCENIVPVDELYSQLASRGLQYGPAFQGIQQLSAGEDVVLAKIAISESIVDELDQYHLHPTLLDACFQSLIAIAGSNFSDEVFVPVSIDRIEFYQSPKREFYCVGQLMSRADRSITGDLVLSDVAGQVYAKVKGLCCQALPSKQSNTLRDYHYHYQWQSQPLSNLQSRDAQGVILIVGDAEFTLNLQTDFLAMHADLECLISGIQDINVMLDQYADTLSCVIYCPAIDTANDETGILAAISFSQFCQKLLACNLDSQFCLYVVSALADYEFASVEQPPTVLSQASLLGVGRVLMTEHPELNLTMIDAPEKINNSEWKTLTHLLLSNSSYKECLIKDHSLYVRSLCNVVPDVEETEAKVQVDDMAGFQLVLKQPGVLSSLSLEQEARRAPNLNEVELKVHTSGLNFKDIMKAMGMLTDTVLDDTYLKNSLGLECSATVLAIGEGVTDFSVGDEVILAAEQGSFHAYLTVDLNTTIIVRKPSNLSMASAPLLIPFFAIYYGLHEMAKLQKSEKILIHAATGGVGLAAIQYAQYVGAEIYATAGTEEKREYLRQLGIQHIMDSRSLKFADQILDWTNGEGVDVVLNSLSGESLVKSFEVLAPYGRFIEVGKKDFDDNSPLPMRAFYKNLSFTAVDVDRMLLERRELSYRMLHQICDLFEQGIFTALPNEVFPVAEITTAFRKMSRAQHIGKMSVDFTAKPAEINQAISKKPLVIKQACYVITGGTSGFGLESARLLVAEGAQQIILVSRSGISTAEAKNSIAEMQQQGCDVIVIKADIACQADVNSLFASLEHCLPLKGIIHAAGVLDDRQLLATDEQAYQTVMQPKVTGAWLLHKQTTHLVLDFFILYSSVSALIGNTGQANYCAANTFLDALAHHRHLQNLPALSINWGVIADVGMAARNKEVSKNLRAQGINAIKPQLALSLLKNLVEENIVQAGVMDVNWQQWAAANPVYADDERFVELINNAKSIDDKKDLWLQQLLACDAIERRQQIELLVAEKIAQILRMPADKLNDQHGFDQLGVDSLMSVEILAVLQMTFSVVLTATDVMAGASVSQLARIIDERLQAFTDEESSVTGGDILSETAVVNNIDDINEAALDTLLEQLL